MRKKIIIALLFFGVLIAGFFIYSRNNSSVLINELPSQPQVNSEKSQQEKVVANEKSCNKDEDCALASNLPNSKGSCVNKAWLDDWNKNPESEKYARDCIVGPVCSGPKFVAGGMRTPKNSCQCVNSGCQLANMKDYPGCQLVGCE